MASAEKKPRFSYAEMKAGATSKDRSVREKTFRDYFERFGEFPSYLFDNENGIDVTLLETMKDIENDPATPKATLAGVAALFERLSVRAM